MSPVSLGTQSATDHRQSQGSRSGRHSSELPDRRHSSELPDRRHRTNITAAVTQVVLNTAPGASRRQRCLCVGPTRPGAPACHVSSSRLSVTQVRQREIMTHFHALAARLVGPPGPGAPGCLRLPTQTRCRSSQVARPLASGFPRWSVRSMLYTLAGVASHASQVKSVKRAKQFAGLAITIG